jgi:hypothetical protein
MKALLEFNLPEDREEFVLALDGADLSYRLDKLDERLRSVTKHEDPWLKEEIQKQLDDGTQCPAIAAALVFRALLGEVKYPSLD